MSAIINTSIRDHIVAYTTKDTSETLSLVRNIYSRIKKTPENYVPSGTNASCDATQTQQLVKLKNPSKMDVYLAQLRQIPGVSMKTAQEIAAVYPSMKSLMTSFDIKTSIKVGQRSVSKTIMNALDEMVHGMCH
jgi:ERCC4-type nuclease